MNLLPNIISAIAALVAAYFWWQTSKVRVISDYIKPLNEDVTYLNFMGARGPILIEPDGTRIDITATAVAQNRLNAKAALAAGIAAAAQVLGAFVPLLS